MYQIRVSETKIFTKQISREHMQNLIVDVRFHPGTDELDLYVKSGRNELHGMLERVCSIPAPENVLELSKNDKLLEYARNNLPQELSVQTILERTYI